MTPEEAIAAAIAGEDACIYAYGVIGGQLNTAGQRKARKALDSHRVWRDAWQSRQSGSFTPAAAAYDLPSPVTDPESARALAMLIEQRMVAVYADVASATSGDDRAQAVTAACECATRAVTWGAPSQAFPSGAA